MSDTRLTFKEMCARFDVTPRTLRYYEYIELLQPEKEGRARFYGPREIARMTLILRGRRFGFGLEEIRQWLLIYQQKGTRPQLEAWIEMADRQLKELARQRAELEVAIADLQALRDSTAAELAAPEADTASRGDLTSRHVYVNVKHSGISVRAIHLEGCRSPSRACERVMTSDVMTIREMCDAYDVTPRTLRFYESKELLFPIRDGTRRLFTRRDRARLKLILRGKRFGFSLEEIRQLLDLYDRDGSQELQLARTYQVAQQRLEQMERQRAELDEAIAELKDQLAWGEEALAAFRRAAAE